MMDLITLVERATQGDAGALGHLVTEYWRFVYTICLSQVGRPAEAEDLTQEVFVRVSRDLAALREPAKFLPWLRQVTRNVCRMWRRRQRATPEPLDAIADVDDPAAAARLRQSELSEAELAVACGVSPSTIKSRLHEAREQAKRTLLPIVRELLSLRPRSIRRVEPTLPRYGKAGCACGRVLTDTR